MNEFMIGIMTILLLVIFRKFSNRKVDDYKEYLNSWHWKRTRKRALKRYGYKCMICGRKDNLQIHHNNYKNLRHEKPNDLLCLCDYHHKMIHNKLKNNSQKIAN